MYWHVCCIAVVLVLPCQVIAWAHASSRLSMSHHTRPLQSVLRVSQGSV